MSEPLVRDDAFDRARNHFMQGLASLQAQRYDDAEAEFSASLRYVPGRVSTLVNLAAARLGQRRFAEALEAADRLLDIEADHRDGWYHRGNALAGLRRLDDAVQAFARALAIDGAQGEIWWCHARALHALDRRDEALASYRRDLALRPDHGAAWARCGDILREQHRLDEAAHAFEQAIVHGADNPLTRYFLAAVTQGSAPEGAPHAYVQTLFDGYADDFDGHLVGQLGYQAHRVLAEQLHALAGQRFGSALDLGCGTGLCGPLVRSSVGRLVGVDLSAAMLERARALGVYDDLVQADVVEHLATTTQVPDLVLAADLLIYLGELTPLFQTLGRATRSGALFCFSVELPEREGVEVELMPSLRYRHSQAYLQRIVTQSGFEVVGLRREPLRFEQRVPIDGLYVVSRRS